MHSEHGGGNGISRIELFHLRVPWLMVQAHSLVRSSTHSFMLTQYYQVGNTIFIAQGVRGKLAGVGALVGHEKRPNDQRGVLQRRGAEPYPPTAPLHWVAGSMLRVVHSHILLSIPRFFHPGDLADFDIGVNLGKVARQGDFLPHVACDFIPNLHSLGEHNWNGRREERNTQRG